MYLIIGRTGAGKTHLESVLEKKGLKTVKSYTDRPPRSKNDHSHTFISTDEILKIVNSEKCVAHTCINNVNYCADTYMIADADVYVIDPKGVDELLKKMPDKAFNLIYIKTSIENRENAILERVSDEDKKEQHIIFENRNQDEDEQFTEFEKRILKEQQEEYAFPTNVISYIVYENTFSEDDCEEFADYLIAMHQRTKQMSAIIQELKAAKVPYLPYAENNDDSDYLELTTIKPDKTTKKNLVTCEQFAERILANEQALGHLMECILSDPHMSCQVTYKDC